MKTFDLTFAVLIVTGKCSTHDLFNSFRPSKKTHVSRPDFYKKESGRAVFFVIYYFLLHAFFKQLLDEVFVISRIIKVEVRVISRSRRLRLITLTETLIILDITKTESNNCFIIH